MRKIVFVTLCFLLLVAGCGKSWFKIPEATINIYFINESIEDISTYNLGEPLETIEQGKNCDCVPITPILDRAEKVATTKELIKNNSRYLMEIIYKDATKEYYYLLIDEVDEEVTILVNIEQVNEYRIIAEDDIKPLNSYIPKFIAP